MASVLYDIAKILVNNCITIRKERDNIDGFGINDVFSDDKIKIVNNTDWIVYFNPNGIILLDKIRAEVKISIKGDKLECDINIIQNNLTLDDVTMPIKIDDRYFKEDYQGEYFCNVNISELSSEYAYRYCYWQIKKIIKEFNNSYYGNSNDVYDAYVYQLKCEESNKEYIKLREELTELLKKGKSGVEIINYYNDKKKYIRDPSVKYFGDEVDDY